MSSQPDNFEIHHDVNNADCSAVDHLAKASGLGKQVIKQAMNKGAVWLTRGKHTRRLRRASRTVNPGDTLHLYYNEQLLAIQPPEPILIADETDYSVWYKPCGMLSQGSKWGDHCTITRWAAQHLQPERPAFIVHRLDRAATGLILVAHTKKMTTALANLFQQRTIRKHYKAIVMGRFPASPTELTVDDPLEGRIAVSHISLVEYSKALDRSLVSIRIETGRKHQIRRHLATAGFPIVGDRRYGSEAEPLEDLQLTAVSLDFSCPLTGIMRHYALDKNLIPGF